MDPFDLRQWSLFHTAGGSLSEPAIVDQITIDSRRIDSTHSLFVALKGDHQDGHAFVKDAAAAGAKYALVSERWQPSEPIDGLMLLRVPDPLRAFQEIAKTYRMQLPTKIIGITGSFGKTMVKDLLHTLLSTQNRSAASPESFNSQIGVPLSLLTLRKEHEIAVIEAAISQQGEMNYLADLIRPDYTLMTPLGKKHLSTLNNLETLAQETMKLILATPDQGWALLPRESLLQNYYSNTPCPHYFWNETHDMLPHVSAKGPELILPAPYQILFPDRTSYQGTLTTGYSYFFNLLNMSIKAAWLLSIPSENIISILRDYQPEPMRTEIWKAPTGTLFINDTYCSDPQSVDRALDHFLHASRDQRKVFVFGGMRGRAHHLENDYKHIGHALHKSGVDNVILFGNKAFGPLIDALKQPDTNPKITVCDTSEEALSFLRLSLHPHDLVLIKGESKISLDTLTETFNDSLNNNQCTINLAAIRTNLATIKKKLPPSTRLMVIVKALAYGTDDVRMAKFLATCGVDILGVSYVDEAVALRREGVTQSLFSINAADYEVSKVVKWDLEVGVSHLGLIDALGNEAVRQNKIIKVHLHINTGMGRFGCRPEEALDLAQAIHRQPNLRLEGIMTHFACAEDPSQDAFTRQQVALFDQAIERIKKAGIEATWIHAANSSGAIRFHLPQYNMVRIGLATYGLYVSDSARQELDLRLALSLTSRIVGINICKKGESVSYGRSYTVEKEFQKVAVLPIGYFDGLHRNYSGKSHVFIRGMKAPMIGNICMDYMMVDVTEIPNAEIGDRVLIFGEDEFGQYLSPEDLAASGDSIVHELITCLGPRIQRIFVYEEGSQIR